MQLYLIGYKVQWDLRKKIFPFAIKRKSRVLHILCLLFVFTSRLIFAII